MCVYRQTERVYIYTEGMVNWKVPAIGLGVAVVAGAIGYGVYFDYKRRNDPAFRRKLREEKARARAEAEREAAEADQRRAAAKASKESPVGKAGSGAGAIVDPIDLTMEEIATMAHEERVNLLQELLMRGEFLAQQGKKEWPWGSYDVRRLQEVSQRIRLRLRTPRLH